MSLASKNVRLCLAAETGQEEDLRKLLAEGADPNTADCGPMFWACLTGHIGCVKILLDHGANVDGQDGAPICQAAHQGHADIIKLLFDRGAKIPAGNRAIIWACQQNRPEAVETILTYQKDFDPQECLIAAGGSDPKITTIILRHTPTYWLQVQSQGRRWEKAIQAELGRRTKNLTKELREAQEELTP